MRRIFPYSAVRPLESLESAIEKSKPDMIIPCDERGVRHLHELFSRTKGESEPRGRIAALIERSLGSPDSYPIVSSRYDLLKLAAEEGIRVPDTRQVNGVADLRSWHAEQAFPLVLKADCTNGGSGVAVVQSVEEAHAAFLQLIEFYRGTRVLKRLIINRDPFWVRPWWQRHRPTVVAQAYIEGRPANCGVVCWDGRVLAGSGVEVVGSAGPTGPASVVRLVDSPEMMSAAEVIARRLNLSGFFGLDFVIEHKTRRAYLIEMNPRCTILCHLRLGKGRDMVGALWAQLAGQPLQEIPAATKDGMIAYFPQAWTSNDEHLESSFPDIPHDEPELVHELLRPWPDRTLLYRLGNALTALRTQKS
jgi:glutathione synthase/RimK-type ligase-like ATP-grasp enzyme